MAWIAVTLGRPSHAGCCTRSRCTTCCSRPRRAATRRATWARALGRPATWRDLYRHIHTFASTVLDRVYFVRGQMQDFDLQMHGDAGCDETLAERRGGFLLGAHLGSFEALHAAGKSFPGMRVTMVMYPDNARKIHSVLQAVAPDFKLAVIAIGKPGSTLAIRDALDDGKLVGLLGDRVLGAASARSGSIGDSLPGRARALFGRPAAPGHAAAPARDLHGRAVPGRQTLRRALRDHGRLQPARPPTPPRASARSKLPCTTTWRAWKRLCREAPYNWFNFYDFWREDCLLSTAPVADGQARAAALLALAMLALAGSACRRGLRPATRWPRLLAAAQERRDALHRRAHRQRPRQPAARQRHAQLQRARPLHAPDAGATGRVDVRGRQHRHRSSAAAAPGR